MLVIALINTKGGVGKTTLASNLAVRAALDFERVALVDLDPQKSLIQWWMSRGRSKNPSIFEGPELLSDAKEALELNSAIDVLVADLPPAFMDVLSDAARAADLVLVPVKCSGADLRSTQDAVALAQEAGVPYLIVVNDVIARDGLEEGMRKALATGKAPVAKTSIQHRPGYSLAVSTGKAAGELKGASAKAAREEIDALWAEILAAIKKARKNGGAK